MVFAVLVKPLKTFQEYLATTGFDEKAFWIPWWRKLERAQKENMIA
jgi:hypothetical protein